MKVECWPDCENICPFREEIVETTKNRETRELEAIKSLPKVPGLEVVVIREAEFFCSSAEIYEHPLLGTQVRCNSKVLPAIYALKNSLAT
jgi:hypothetical protein